MIAGLACMQLVEKGKLHLDDREAIESLIPEFKESQVLQKRWKVLFQPGEGWEYGVHFHFAGIALERATGLSSNDYCHKNIFEPLGLKSISMFPTAEMKKKLACMNHRNKDGSLITRDHLLRKPLVVESSEVKDVLNSGGAGCFAKPSDYAHKSSDVRCARA
ncbi:beta-lactamase [Stagonosporopsis vannaccii]|nr:beta-lactamase [Stagonosporopsis vannaccii]